MDLRLPWCGSGADGTVLILQALSTVSALKGLDFSGSIFNSEGVNLLSKYLHPSHKVMLAVIRSTDITLVTCSFQFREIFEGQCYYLGPKATRLQH